MSLLNNYTNQVRQLELSQNDSTEAFEIIMNGKAELEDLILFLTSSVTNRCLIITSS